ARPGRGGAGPVVCDGAPQAPRHTRLLREHRLSVVLHHDLRTPAPPTSPSPGSCAAAPGCACTTSARCAPPAARSCSPWT
ncbi:hypothetical protein, partial [Streptomyces nigra]